MRHNFTEKNARISVDRLRGLVDVDTGGLRLLQPGIREAELLFDAAEKASNSGTSAKGKRKRRVRRAKKAGTTIAV